MKKELIIVIMFLMLPLAMIAQSAGGQITRKPSTTKINTPKLGKKGPQQKHHQSKPAQQQSVREKQKQEGFKKAIQERSIGEVQKQRERIRPILDKIISNMVYVNGGAFSRCDKGTPGPYWQVTVSSFYIGKYEVTQEEWEAVMESNPSYFKGDNNLPVENVSWYDCQKFVSILNELTGKQFRLPTEAEWEFAARGGIKSRGREYSGSNIIDEVAWYPRNSSGKTHDVGTKFPNELGLFDMSGNVWEWCQDWYDSYGRGEKKNPIGPTNGSYRVDRGGSWNSFAENCSVSDRDKATPIYKSSNLGLRLVLSK